MNIKVSKLDGASRQLDAAIKLWFSDDDPVVIHALTWASYQIIQDINDIKGDKSVTLIELARASVKPELVEETVREFRKEMTFFKHANRDPHDILDFDPDRSEPFMLMGIHGLKSLGERLSDLQGVFLRWQFLHRKDRFSDMDFVLKHLSPQQLDNLRRIDKKEFLKQGLLGMAMLKI
jgi:hypothetical protein